MDDTGSSNLRELARSTYFKGYNCAEAIVTLFSWKYSLNINQRMATAMGGGIGGSKSLCGALNGAILVLGALFGRETPEENSTEVYKMAKTFYERFEKKINTAICRDITSGVEWKSAGHKELCSSIIGEAAIILDEIIKENKVVPKN